MENFDWTSFTKKIPDSADLQSVLVTARHNTKNLKSQSLWARIANLRYRNIIKK